MEATARGRPVDEGGYLWRGEFRLWDNEILMGSYAASDGSVRSKGTMYFVMHPHGINMTGRWVELGYDARHRDRMEQHGEDRGRKHEDSLTSSKSRRQPTVDEVCEVVITAPDPDWLAEFTHKLVLDPPLRGWP